MRDAHFLAAGFVACMAGLVALAGCASERPEWRAARGRTARAPAVWIAEGRLCPAGAPRHPWRGGAVVTSDHSEAALRAVAERFAAEGRPVPVLAGGRPAGLCAALRADGRGLWARAALTGEGARLARAGLRHMNPVFEEFVDGHSATGVPRRLLAVRLEAAPAL